MDRVGMTVETVITTVTVVVVDPAGRIEVLVTIAKVVTVLTVSIPGNHGPIGQS